MKNVSVFRVGRQAADIAAYARHRETGNVSRRLPTALTNELLTLFQNQDWKRLEAVARRAVARHSRHPIGWRALGKALLQMGRAREAVAVLSEAVRLDPGEADARNDLGFAFRSLGQLTEAEACCRRAVTLNPLLIEAHGNLGVILHEIGRYDEAVACHRRAIELNPTSAISHGNLGASLRESGRSDEAEVSYRRALALNPAMEAAHINLGLILRERRQYAAAIACFHLAVRLDPGSFQAHYHLAIAQRDAGRLAEAEGSIRQALGSHPNDFAGVMVLGGLLEAREQWEEACDIYRTAIRINPRDSAGFHALGRLLSRLGGSDDNAMLCLTTAIALNQNFTDAFVELGNLRMRIGQADAAMELFRHAQSLRPLVTWPANREKAAFSALFLDTPLGGSTPVGFLAGNAPYDRHFHYIIPDGWEDIDILRSKADVIFNMICNPDDGATSLPLAAELIARIGRPVVNHPGQILGTGRDEMARRLAGLANCVVPRTLRVGGATLIDGATREEFAAMRLPLLIRPAGTHGGDDLEKCDSWRAVADFAARRPDADYYLAEWYDYRSADRQFRKYRLMFIDGEILPYHLAIHDDWKVHHYRTDMAERAWKRTEEERFLRDMDSVFDPRLRETAQTIAVASGVDYGGIDCGIDRDGRLVVFEVNAAMLVHAESSDIFAYKNAASARIKHAFDAMLTRRHLTVPAAQRLTISE